MKKWLIFGLYGIFFGIIAYIFGAVWDIGFFGYVVNLITPNCLANNFCIGSIFYFVFSVGAGFLVGLVVYFYLKQKIGEK